jgi:hypothetical protein
MSSLVSLFLCMTLIYFAYATITYKVVLVYMGDISCVLRMFII